MTDLCPWDKPNLTNPLAWRLYFWVVGYLEGDAAAGGGRSCLLTQPMLDELLEVLCDAEEDGPHLGKDPITVDWSGPSVGEVGEVKLSGSPLGYVNSKQDLLPRWVVNDLVKMLNEALGTQERPRPVVHIDHADKATCPNCGTLMFPDGWAEMEPGEIAHDRCDVCDCMLRINQVDFPTAPTVQVVIEEEVDAE